MVPPVSLSVQVVERGVDSVAPIKRVKNVTRPVLFEFYRQYGIYSDNSKFTGNNYSPLTIFLH